MKIALIVLLVCSCAFGQPDVAPEIDSVMRAVSDALPKDDKDAAGLLFTADGRRDIGELRRYFGSQADRPLSEETAPRLVARAFRRVSDDYVEVDAAITRFGSLILSSRVPVFLVLRRYGDRWLVDYVRVLTP